MLVDDPAEPSAQVEANALQQSAGAAGPQKPAGAAGPQESGGAGGAQESPAGAPPQESAGATPRESAGATAAPAPKGTPATTATGSAAEGDLGLGGPARPLTEAERQRSALLVTTRRRATGLLVAMTVLFGLSTAFVHEESWLEWVQAAAAASMVGGLADWFAVTALFRRPLGLPIPHTAIVVERKDRFAETLGTFVQENFLTPEAVISRLTAAGALPRAAGWLADEEHAAELAARAAQGLVSAAGLLRDDDVHQVVDALVRQRLDDVALAPLAGRVLEQLTKDGRHEPLVDAGLETLSNYLRDHGSELHARLGIRSPWWVPGPLSRGMVQRLLARSQSVLSDMAHDRNHPLRQQLREGLARGAEQLQTDSDLRRRGEEVKAELLAEPTVREFAAALWRDVKDQLRVQAAQPDSELRTRLTGFIQQTGERLRDDPALAASAERSIEALTRFVLGNFKGELVSLVSGTIARWDAIDTSRRLELLLGPDLQYIRINGTVFGAVVGLILHAVGLAAG